MENEVNLRQLAMTSRLYTEQNRTWPKSGKHILAHFDTDSIVVYQAFRRSIAEHAVKYQKFGGDFSYSRMSWIKPNFLWMMFRSGWASKEGQEHVLAVQLRRPFFDKLLGSAVPSTYDSRRFSVVEEWRAAVDGSDVRVQWDPDHDPLGAPVERRAIQLGLRGKTLNRYGQEELLSVRDITVFVHEQRAELESGLEKLSIPEARIYLPADEQTAWAIGLDTKATSVSA